MKHNVVICELLRNTEMLVDVSFYISQILKINLTNLWLSSDLEIGIISVTISKWLIIIRYGMVYDFQSVDNMEYFVFM